MIRTFALLTDTEFKALIPDVTLFIFPIGGLEQHGTHLPYGTKILQIEEWSRLLALKIERSFPGWNVVLMPLLPFTVDTVTTHTSLTVRPHVMRDALVDQCESLKKMGFSQFAAFSSHMTPKQLVAIEDASKIVSKGRKYSLVSLSSGMIDSKDVWKSPMISLPLEHGGAFDTGSILASNPELVSPAAKTLAEVEAPHASAGRFFQYFRGEIDGYWGNPAAASTELFIQKIDREFDLLVEKMKPVMEQGRGRSFFFSAYRFIPFNGSFFKAYLMAIIFFFSVLAWIMWGLKDVFEQ